MLNGLSLFNDMAGGFVNSAFDHNPNNVHRSFSRNDGALAVMLRTHTNF